MGVFGNGGCSCTNGGEVNKSLGRGGGGGVDLLVKDSMNPGADPGFRRGGGGSYIQKGGGGSYRNFRSGSKLLQDPGQINKQKKLQTAVGGGGSDHPKPPCIRAWNLTS